MGVMRTVYAKSGIQSQHVSNYTRGKRSRKAREYYERKARIVCEQHFDCVSLHRLLAVKVLWKCANRFSVSLVRISEFLYAISRSLAYGVRISSNASATAVLSCNTYKGPFTHAILRPVYTCDF